MEARPDAVRRILERFVEVCRADPRVAAAVLSGSYARGGADRHSDVDLIAVALDDSIDQVQEDRHGLVRRLGEPLFLEDFGSDTTSFFVLADGTEGELSVATRDGLAEVHVGPLEAIDDPDGILDGLTFPPLEADPARQRQELERAIRWFWHELSHFVAAVDRGELWWAAGQLEALRRHVVNLARIDAGVDASDEPYEKIDRAIDVGALEALRGTFVELDRRALLRAGRTTLNGFRERGSALAERFDVEYPIELDRLLTSRLDEIRPA